MKNSNIYIKNSIIFLLVFLVFAICFLSSCKNDDFSNASNNGSFEKNQDEPSFAETKNNAYGLYVDNNFITACKTKKEIENVLSDIKKQYIINYLPHAADANAHVSFDNKIEIVHGQYDFEIQSSAEELRSLIYYDPDNLFRSHIYNVHREALPIMLSINAEITETNLDDCDFNTNINYLISKPDYYIETISEGENGIVEIKYRVSYRNGVLINVENKGETIIKEPIDRVINIGIATEKYISGIIKFIKPYNGRISSNYGYRTFSNGETNFHNGIDYIATSGSCYGDKIMAAFDGVVEIASSITVNGYGKYVVIRHAGGIRTYYGHMSKVLANPGDVVKQGDYIGEIGNTGKSTGPHLHFGVNDGGVFVNPSKFYE